MAMNRTSEERSKSFGLCLLSGAAVVIVAIGAVSSLCGCGPAVSKDELGEILTEVPPELQFETPYPVPWEKGSAETAGAAEEATSQAGKPAGEASTPAAEESTLSAPEDRQPEEEASSAGSDTADKEDRSQTE